jgi:hypothetical protein
MEISIWWILVLWPITGRADDMALIRSMKKYSDKFYISRFFVLFFAILMVFSTSPACASTLNISASASEIPPNGENVVSFELETEGEAVNAIEGSVRLEGSACTISDIRTGISDIPFWVEHPKILSESVRFAGVIPGGRTDNVTLFHLVLACPSEGLTNITVDGLRVLLNDGLGTETASHVQPFAVTVRAGATTTLSNISESIDRDAPEQFSPEIVSDSALFEGVYVLLFSTQDKKSGMERYEVFESRRMLTSDESIEWRVATSPYVLQDQSLKSFVFIRALDRDGNARMVRLEPRHPLLWYEQEDFAGIMMLIGIVALASVFIVVSLVWRKKKLEKQSI